MTLWEILKKPREWLYGPHLSEVDYHMLEVKEASHKLANETMKLESVLKAKERFRRRGTDPDPIDEWARSLIEDVRPNRNRDTGNS